MPASGPHTAWFYNDAGGLLRLYSIYTHIRLGT